MPVEVDVVRPAEFDAALSQRWNELLALRPAPASPFHGIDWVRGVAEALPATRVGILTVDGAVGALWPLEPLGRFDAGPVGRSFADHQTVLWDSSCEISPSDLLRRMGVIRWRFDHLSGGVAALDGFADSWSRSPIITTTGGRASIEERRATRGSKLTRWLRQQRRLLERSGELRFESTSTDASVLDELVRWKSDQYRASGARNVLGSDWAITLLHSLARDATAGCSLSVLWCGDRPAAAHLGLRSDEVWHYWLPAYDPALSEGSPGTILLDELTASAAESGALHVDLGRGSESYKARFADGEISVGAGQVLASGTRARAIRQLRSLRRRVTVPTRAG